MSAILTALVLFITVVLVLLVFVAMWWVRTTRATTVGAALGMPNNNSMEPARSPNIGVTLSRKMSDVQVAQAQVQTSSLRIEKKNGETHYIVNGVNYIDPSAIPDGLMRAEALLLRDRLSQLPTPAMANTDAALEALADPNAKKYQIKIQKHNNEMKILVDGVPYSSVDDIPDTTAREAVRQIMQKI